MFIFIDESGVSDLKSSQKYLIVAFALMGNRAFADELIFEIKDKCKKKGKEIHSKEVKFHDLSPLQREIAVQTINSKYKNFYICFLDLEKCYKPMVTGQYEFQIQKSMIHNLLVSINREKVEQYANLRIIMDKKLSKEFQDSIRHELQKHFGTKKGIEVRTENSGKERGIQVADIIAGAFRSKLLKRSDLFEVDVTHLFQITIPDDNTFKTERVSMK
jgi:hypothetical protein